MSTLKIGDEVTIKLEGVIDEVDSGHGRCYLVRCSLQDFGSESLRKIWVNDNSGEIIARRPRTPWPKKYRCRRGHEFIDVDTLQLSGHPLCTECSAFSDPVRGKFVYLYD